MAKKSHVVFVEVSAQEIEMIFKQHPGEERDVSKLTKMSSGLTRSVESADELLEVLHMVSRFTQL
jgi:hypothetical protein